MERNVAASLLAHLATLGRTLNTGDEKAGYLRYAADDFARFATRRGLLDADTDHGMDGLVGGADVFFDRRRAALISGVREGVLDPDNGD